MTIPTLKSVSLITLTIASAGIGLNAHAGQETHGGHGIVCPAPNGGRTVELLDYYEGKASTGLTLETGSSQSDYMEQVRYVLGRLAKTDPIAAARLSERAQNFLNEASFVSEAQIKPVGDANEIINPDTGCYKAQFAVQFFDLRPQQKRYMINSQLWAVADAQTKAGLVLHELIYTDAVNSFKQTNSDNTRYFNFIISSEQMNRMTREDYNSLVSTAGFDLNKEICLFSLKFRGIPMCLSAYSGYQYTTATTESGKRVGLFDMQAAQPFEIKTNDGVTLRGPAKAYVRFDSDDHLGSIGSTNGDEYGETYPEISLNGRKVTFTRQFSIMFYETGDVQGGYLPKDQSLLVGGREIPVDSRQLVKFYKNGKVLSVQSPNSMEFQLENTKANFYTDEFYENGNLKAAWLKVSNSVQFGCLFGGSVSFVNIEGKAVEFSCDQYNKNPMPYLEFDEQGRLIRFSDKQ